MSITLDKLRALKRQAGGALPDKAAATEPPRSGVSPPPHVGGLPATRTETTPLAGAQPQSRVRTDAGRSGLQGIDHDDAAPGPTAAAHTPPQSQGTPCLPSSGAPDPSDPLGLGLARENRSADARRGSLDTLRRLLDVRERRPVAAPVRRGAVERGLPGEEIMPGLHYIETRIAYAAPEAALPLAFARRDGHVDPRALLFFDTETTGLAGGTGTRAFMIGAADWHGDSLRVRQLLIATMAAESAMLREFASWLSPTTVLASYNGRSYDAPLLKTRYRLARLSDPLLALDHLDLLHPTRRRYRGRWENCKLATIERELLRIVREDDLPGSQAPMAWLGYLRGGASTLLHRVAAHNHQDVVTLARLLTRLADADGNAEPG